MVHQISGDIKYLIRTKQKRNPTPNYSTAQSFEWETEIPIIELLMYLQTMVTHGKQSNDTIIQSALKEVRFGMNLSDISSGDKITLKTNPQLQQVMLKSLMNTLSKSKPAAFCKDIHIYIQSRLKTEV